MKALIAVIVLTALALVGSRRALVSRKLPFAVQTFFTGAEFILLKCVQMDDMAKQLVKDILNDNIQKDKALSMLHSTGIINALTKKREIEKAATLELADSVRLRQCVKYCIPENFL